MVKASSTPRLPHRNVRESSPQAGRGHPIYDGPTNHTVDGRNPASPGMCNTL